MQKLNIFMDTNIIKSINPDLLHFSFNDTYVKLKEFIDENEYEKINIIIPRIVIEELIRQYIEDYEDKYENLDSYIDDILNKSSKIGWDIKVNKNNNMSIDEYEQYIEKQVDEYIQREKLNIIELPKENFLNIIKRAINKELPFFGGKGSIYINGDKKASKEFSDAGFKDAIFLESIIEFSKLEKSNMLVLTKDNILLEELNWKSEIENNNIIVKGIDQGISLVKYICQIEDIKDFSEYRKFIKTEYYKDIIYNAIGKKVIKTIDIEENNEEDITYIDIKNIVKDKKGKDIIIIVRINDEKEFIEIFNKDGEVIYEW